MTYVARVSNDIMWDIERNFSCWGGRNNAVNLVETALENVGYDLSDAALEAIQSRWIRSYGEQYEDFDTFRTAYIEELIEKNDERVEGRYAFDSKYRTFGTFHHFGLSCWSLPVGSLDQAMEYVVDDAFGIKHEMTIGDQTVGKVEYVCSIFNEATGEVIHILKTENVIAEEWIRV